ncbi:MAG: nuclear transport factor 2 family protein [Candidatus Acidiferrales bacterium]
MLGILLFLLMLPAQGPAQNANDVNELLRLETVWNQAHEKGDAAALDALWDEDLQVAVPKMPVMSKAQALAFARTGRMKFQRYETSDVKARVYGDAAVVTGQLNRTRVMNGKTVEDNWRFTKVYVRRGGTWKVVAFHASEAAGP